MKQMKMSNLDLNLFYEKLDNGLEVYIIPRNMVLEIMNLYQLEKVK